MAILPVGPWRPDQPALGSAHVTEALNVVPAGTSYRPLGSLTAFGNAVGSRVQGSIAARGLGGTVVNLAGTATDLTRWDGVDWNTVSGASAPYATPATGGWDLCQFGDRIIATNGTDPVQKFDITTDTTFADLAGNPPIAKYCATIADFVMLGNLDGQQNRVQWCGINNTDIWTPLTQQSDFQSIPTGGQVMGLVGGTVGLVFLERAVNRFVYAGPPLIFQRDEIARDIGAVASGAIVGLGNRAFFLAESGFHGTIDAASIAPIGDGQVDRFFWDDLDQTALHRISSAIDPVNKLYVVSYPSRDAGGTPDRLLLYHWPSGWWGRARISLDRLHQLVNQIQHTLETLGALGPIDDLDFSFDSRILRSQSRLLLAGFDPTHRLAPFAGPNLEAVIETAEGAVLPGRVATVTGVRPLIEGLIAEGLSVAVGSRFDQHTAVTYGPAVPVNSAGFCPARRTGRYHRAKLTIPAGAEWSHALGVEVVPEWIVDAGSR